MKLDPTDKYVNHIILLTNMDEESRKRLVEDAEKVYGSPWGLKLKDFFALVQNDLSYLGLDDKTAIAGTVRQYVWLTEFRDVSEQVVAILNKYKVPMSDMAKKASEMCLKMDFMESTLVFVRNYFGLKSFEEAENTTLSDFIVAKKDNYNSGMFEYAMYRMQKEQFSKKK